MLHDLVKKEPDVVYICVCRFKDLIASWTEKYFPIALFHLTDTSRISLILHLPDYAHLL